MEEKLSTEHRLTEVEERSKSNKKRLDEFEKRLDDTTQLVTSVAVMAEKLKNMEVSISDVQVTLRKIAEKPGKRWDSIVEKVLLGVVAAVVAFMLANIGL